jgi:iron complex transport system ATP-binding protein
LLNVTSLSHHICARDKRHVILDDITMRVGQGDIIAIIGPNGAGKSTLLNILSGAHAPSFGEVLFRGTKLHTITQKQRARHFAVIHQSNEIDPRLIVGDYVALGRIPYWHEHSPEQHKVIVERVMEKVFLTSLKHRPIGTLSGGEKQRAILARALAQGPDILFLDEPTNHLDPQARNSLLMMVKDLSLTTIMVMHDLPQAISFATHALLLKQGRMLSCDTIERAMVKENLLHLFGLHFFEVPHPDNPSKKLFFDVPSLH